MDYSTQIVFLILCTKCVAVNIRRVEVPSLVEIGTESIILDCEYTMETVPPRLELVIKWFFNSASGLVYQWIPPLKPQFVGLLKGRGDMNFKVSDEPIQMYRAIKILNPTTELSGNYTCVVSTFLAEDRQTRSMLVYSPARSFHFFQEKKYVFLVTLICIAEDMYPKPTMVILSRGVPLKQAVTEMNMDSWGSYTVTTKAVVHDDDVMSPSEEFTCLINIPEANYTVNRTTTYYPGLMPTSYIAAYEIQKPEERNFDGNPASSTDISHVWILICLYSVILL